VFTVCKHCRKNIILDPIPTVVDPSDPNKLALNPKVSYCVVIYSKHSRKNIILDPFPTDVFNANSFGSEGSTTVGKGSSLMFFLQCLLYITTQ
jgi:hypothetical protein